MLSEPLSRLHFTFACHEGIVLRVKPKLYCFVLQRTLVGSWENAAGSTLIALGRKSNINVIQPFQVSKIVQVLICRNTIFMYLTNQLPIPAFILHFDPIFILQFIVYGSYIIV